jgi:cytochrome c-type biogenesis protein CcmH
MMRIIFAFALAMLTQAAAISQDAVPPAPYAYTQLADPQKEATASQLMHNLRCLVCDGQSIADSDAALAGDMRSLVRSRIAAGESAPQVQRWMVERFGAAISYDPPFAGPAMLLWILPFLCASGAVLLFYRRVRKRQTRST